MLISGLVKNIYRRAAVTVLSLPVLIMPVQALETWSHPDDSVVVARWSKEELKPLPQTSAQRMEEIKKHFVLADKPGESWRYDRIHVLMDGLETSQKDATGVTADEVIYYRARLLQHRHEFVRAAKMLEEINHGSPLFISARLMTAQVYSELGEKAAARNACLSLMLEQADLAAVCSIGLQPIAGAYGHSVLKSLLERLSNDKTPEGRSLTAWALYQKSKSYLHEKQYARVEALYKRWSGDAELTVADLVNRSEALLLDEKPQDVITLLKEYGFADYPDDALIVQLARAEQQNDSIDTYWRDYAEDRINQRIKRRDTSYSELISLYLSTLGKNASDHNLSWLSQLQDIQQKNYLSAREDVL